MTGFLLTDYEISHTFGVYPLQQYMVAFPGGTVPVSTARLADGEGAKCVTCHMPTQNYMVILLLGLAAMPRDADLHREERALQLLACTTD